MISVQVSPAPALNMEKGQFLKGISDYQEKNVARQVKATAERCGW